MKSDGLEMRKRMIIGIGTDIVEVERVLKVCEKDTFLKKYYTEAEQTLIRDRNSRAAANFAAKEAVAKVFGTGFAGFSPNEIEVLRDESGKPYVQLYGKAFQKADLLGIRQIHLTLSDTKEYAVAFAVGEGENSCSIS